MCMASYKAIMHNSASFKCSSPASTGGPSDAKQRRSWQARQAFDNRRRHADVVTGSPHGYDGPCIAYNGIVCSRRPNRTDATIA